jgi:membrane-associated protease RseP (regulator of RpoE activity)
MSRRSQSGAVRWWMPLLWLAAGTLGLIFLGWMAGVDVKAAGSRMHSDLIDFFHHESRSFGNDAGILRLNFDGHHRLKDATHDGEPVPLADVHIDDDDYVTVASLKWEDGELMYWRLPLHWADELREAVSNPRWRLLARVHPRPEGEPAGLRVARVAKDGPGAQAGLQNGDVIVGVDDSRPPTTAGLAELLGHALAERAPGGTLTLDVEHDGQTRTVSIPLSPLVSQQDWDGTPGDDPVERYLNLMDPGWDRGQRPGREVHAQQSSRRR